MSKTVRAFRAELVLQGKTIRDWARENGFSLRSVRAVLLGQTKVSSATPRESGSLLGSESQTHEDGVSSGIR
jgi:gp16 family phage-associated protein